jgi:hypothetical protein
MTPLLAFIAEGTPLPAWSSSPLPAAAAPCPEPEPLGRARSPSRACGGRSPLTAAPPSSWPVAPGDEAALLGPSIRRHSGIRVASSLIFSLMLSRRRRSTALCDSRRRRRFSLSSAALYHLSSGRRSQNVGEQKRKVLIGCRSAG